MRNSQINREILRLAIPNMISNIVIPLLGMVDIAIAGYIGEDAHIAALAIGATIFDVIYWNCAFLRLGTSGLTAQAFGANRKEECTNVLLRALWMAFLLAFLLIVFQKPIGHFSLYVMQGSDRVQALAAEYVFVRMWSAPASITLFALLGWFIGMQDAKTPMMISIVTVVFNIALSLLFTIQLNMGIAGIAWGSVIAQYVGLLISCIFLYTKYRPYLQQLKIKESLQLKPLIHYLHINKDIFIRTAFIVIVYAFFTAASARFGDTILATNSLLLHLFTLFSFLCDGFAFSGEALAGRFVGERNGVLLKRFIRMLLVWSVVIGLFFVLVYIVAWKEILMLFSPSNEVLLTAGQYIGWIIAVPLAGCIPFMIDGIMIGATRTKLLRNTVLIASALFFASFFLLSPSMGNDALWISFFVFLISRGLLLYFCSDRLNINQIMGNT